MAGDIIGHARGAGRGRLAPHSMLAAKTACLGDFSTSRRKFRSSKRRICIFGHFLDILASENHRKGDIWGIERGRKRNPPNFAFLTNRNRGKDRDD
jgi:hypothetical protein